MSNGLGAFELTGIPTGDYQLVLEKEDFVAHTVPTLTINENEIADTGSIELSIYRGSAFGLAQLDDSDDHTGIKVYFSGAEGVAVTLQDGTWDFPDLKSGFYNVFAEYEGYTAPSNAVYVGAGQNVEFKTLSDPQTGFGERRGHPRYQRTRVGQHGANHQYGFCDHHRQHGAV